jgi:hypothetical protein
MQLKRRLESLAQIIAMGERLLTTFDVEELLDRLVAINKAISGCSISGEQL